MSNFSIHTHKKREIINITEKIQSIVSSQKIAEGVIHLFVLHTTAALTTADLDPGTDLDMLDAFEKIVPKLNYRHPHNPAHAPDHILASLIGPDLTIIIDKELLQLGTWQRIVFVECDGPRTRKIAYSVQKI